MSGIPGEGHLPGSATWTTLAPLNGPLAPIRDAAIDRTAADHALNFCIPGSFSTGRVDYRVRVFDAAHPDEPGYTSSRYQGVLEFTERAPLRIRGVGVNFTGSSPVAAPSVLDLSSTLSFVRQTYPVGRVFITGFDVIDYGGDFTDQSGDGCGTGWDGLLERLNEMQGDSDDVYFGLVPSGVLLGWGGCGGGDGRVAAGPVSAGATAAQEIAHAFGRDHAPGCNAGDPDGGYPNYSPLPVGSIGEVGIECSGFVKNPSDTFDFMSYCGPMWVSPYTYEGLMGSFPAVQPSPGPPSGPKAEEAPSRPTEHLFLNFHVYRGGRVEVFPSFHYPARPRLKPGRWTPYGIELRDRVGRVLHAQRVSLSDPHANLDSAALHFFKPIPFHADTARVVFTCGVVGECHPEELLAIDVPREPPSVRFVAPRRTPRISGRVRVTWIGAGSDRQLHYLLRYSHDGGQTWRALGPKTTETGQHVDFDMLPGGDDCVLQVLATEGVRTGVAISEPFSVPHRPHETKIARPEGGSTVMWGEKLRLVGDSYSPQSGSVPPGMLAWRSDLDGLLGRGPLIEVSTLRPGRHVITLEVAGENGEESRATVELEVKRPIPRKHTSLTHPGHTSRDHKLGRIRDIPEGGPRHGN